MEGPQCEEDVFTPVKRRGSIAQLLKGAGLLPGEVVVPMRNTSSSGLSSCNPRHRALCNVDRALLRMAR